MRRAGKVLTTLLLVVAFGCDGDRPADADADADTDADGPVDADDLDPAWWEPDPEGRVTEGDVSGESPELLVVSTAVLAPAWEAYIDYRRLTGMATELAVLEDVLEAEEGWDDAERLRNRLVRAHSTGVRFVLLGGDAEQVPYRRVFDRLSGSFSSDYTTNGPAELYFADVDLDWDRDLDGRWGEDGDDVLVSDLREAELHVGRVPASHRAEVETYARKVERFETEPGGREAHPLVLSDIASTVPLLGEIDAAHALEATIEQIFPAELRDNARRLYATAEAAADFGGEQVTRDLVREAFDEGHDLVFHNGHGSHGWLTDLLDIDFVEALDNRLPPIMLSCACLSGNFADIASTGSYYGWTPQGPDDDSAAERFLVAGGGGVAYVGSTGTGLGPLGGSQILHAVLEGLFVAGLPTLGEALTYGRAHMREVVLRVLGFDMPMSDETERWTQLVTILLGDPTLRPWTAPAGRLALEAPTEYGPGYQELTVAVTDLDGSTPVAGATVTLLKPGDLLLRAVTGADGRTTFRFVPHGPAEIRLMVVVEGMVPARATVAPRT